MYGKVIHSLRLKRSVWSAKCGLAGLVDWEYVSQPCVVGGLVSKLTVMTVDEPYFTSRSPPPMAMLSIEL